MNPDKKQHERRTKLGVTGFVVAGIPSVLAYLGPMHWVFDLFVPFRLQYAVICLVYLFVCLGFRNYLAVACYGIIVGLNLQPVIPLVLPVQQKQEDFDFIAAVHNAHISNQQFDELKDLYNEIDPDLLVVLEPSKEFIDHVATDVAWAAYRHIHFRGDPYNMVVYSKYPLESETRFSQNFPFLVVEMHHPKGKVRAVGIHAPLPWYQLARNTHLIDATASLLEKDLPGIALGDFNMTPYNDAFSATLHDGKLYPARNGFGVQPTWPATPTDFLKIPIDHILVTQGLTVSSFARDATTGSDHSPLVVKLQQTKPSSR